MYAIEELNTTSDDDKNELVHIFLYVFSPKNIPFDSPNLCDWYLKMCSGQKLMN